MRTLLKTLALGFAHIWADAIDRTPADQLTPIDLQINAKINDIVDIVMG